MVRFWRATALAGLLGAVINVGVGIDIAAAHPGHDDHDTDAQHAEQDLVGTSITKIEKDTKLNAAEIKAETGAAPGRRTGDQTVPNAALSSAAATDPEWAVPGALSRPPTSFRYSRQSCPTARF